MTQHELIELLEQTLGKAPTIIATARIGDDALGVEDEHGDRHFVTVESV